MDTSRVGQLAAGLMEDVAEEYADADLEVGTVMLIVELANEGSYAIRARCTDGRDFVQIGLLDAVAHDLRNRPPGD